MTRPRPAHVVSAVATALILAATLPPTREPVGELFQPCLLLCGDEGLSDFLVNIVLYLPLGVGLTLQRWRPRAVVLSAFLLSAAIEALQGVLPGRDPSAGDVVANALGAAVGLWLVRTAPRWLRPSDRMAMIASGLWAAVVVLVVAATAWLMVPSLPHGDWYGQWMPRFGNYGIYGGRLASARLGPLRVPSWKHPEPDSVRALLLAGTPLEVRFAARPPPSDQAPIFRFAAGGIQGVLMISAEHEDLRLSVRRRANDLRLDAPDVRLRGWLEGIASGDSVTIRMWITADGLCASLNGRRACGLAISPARGWAILYWLPRAPGGLQRAVDVLWIAVLFFPLGLWMRPRPAWGLCAGAALAALIVVPALSGLQPSGFVEFIGAAVGLEAGLLARRELGRGTLPAFRPAGGRTNRS